MSTAHGRQGPLRPFTSAPQPQRLRLSAELRWCNAVLDLRMVLEGALHTLVLPEAQAEVDRRDGLWQSTCFELFFAQTGMPGYWEINVAPSGHWNFYVLSGYRQGLRPEARINALPVTWDRRTLRDSEQGLELRLRADLRALLAADATLEANATAVLEVVGEGCSYWAWQHPGEAADFHRRDGLQRLTPLLAP